MSGPTRITGLTNLRRLDLQSGDYYCVEAELVPPGALQPLTALTKLTFLSEWLSEWLLEEWPAELQVLPCLKVRGPACQQQSRPKGVQGAGGLRLHKDEAWEYKSGLTCIYDNLKEEIGSFVCCEMMRTVHSLQW